MLTRAKERQAFTELIEIQDRTLPDKRLTVAQTEQVICDKFGIERRYLNKIINTGISLGWVAAVDREKQVATLFKGQSNDPGNNDSVGRASSPSG